MACAAARVGTDDERRRPSSPGSPTCRRRAAVCAPVPSCSPVPQSSRPVRRASARFVGAAEAAIGAGAGAVALELLARVADATRSTRWARADAAARSDVRDLPGRSRRHRRRARRPCCTAADVFHGRAPDLEQKALVRAFELGADGRVGDERASRCPSSAHGCAAGARSPSRSSRSPSRARRAHPARPLRGGGPAPARGDRHAPRPDDDAASRLQRTRRRPASALWDGDAASRCSNARCGSARTRRAARCRLGAVGAERRRARPGRPRGSGRYLAQAESCAARSATSTSRRSTRPTSRGRARRRRVVEQIADAMLGERVRGASPVAMSGPRDQRDRRRRLRVAFERLRPHRRASVPPGELPPPPRARRSGGPQRQRAKRSRRSAQRLDEIAAVSGTPWVRGLAARGAALLADDDDAEDALPRVDRAPRDTPSHRGDSAGRTSSTASGCDAAMRRREARDAAAGRARRSSTGRRDRVRRACAP